MPRKPARVPRHHAGPRNRLRIIGGQWRGRKLEFPDVPGLRPTPDRVRETLFNWLQPVIAGARCLDLFAGSGALGLEALSRGAAEAVMVDRDIEMIRSLHRHAQTLQAQGLRALQADALAYLDGPAQRFDVVFVDPPYRQGLVAACCEKLEAGGWLAPDARIYLEAEHDLGEPEVPEGWQIIRSKQAGQVGYHLAVRSAGAVTGAAEGRGKSI